MKATKPFRRGVNAASEAAERKISLLTQKLFDGKLANNEWELAVTQTLRKLHTLAAVAANKGKATLSPLALEKLNSILAKQFGYLYEFARELNADAVNSEPQALTRSRMYAAAAHGTYESIARTLREAGGYKFERRVLSKNPGARCKECVDQAALGWQPIGTLKEIGDTQCKSRCRCRLHYRREKPATFANSHYGDHIKSVEEAARDADPNPTPEQKKSGNYRKGHCVIQGLPITIEVARGGFRSGKDKDGTPWRKQLIAHYGYIKRTESEADGDHIDVFIGPNPDKFHTVWIVDQLTPEGDFDECKCMLGYDTMTEAKQGYLYNYRLDWNGLGGMTPMDIELFKQWIKDGDTRNPLSNCLGDPLSAVFNNPKHEPAGSPKGGQFARSSATGASASGKEVDSSGHVTVKAHKRKWGIGFGVHLHKVADMRLPPYRSMQKAMEVARANGADDIQARKIGEAVAEYVYNFSQHPYMVYKRTLAEIGGSLPLAEAIDKAKEAAAEAEKNLDKTGANSWQTRQELHLKADAIAEEIKGTGIMAKLGAAGKWFKQKTVEIYKALENRYGRKQAVGIFAAGHVVGLATPLVVLPGSTIIGMAPFAVLAEVYLQTKRGLKKVKEALFAEEPQLTRAQMAELGKRLVAQLIDLWNHRDELQGA